MARKSSWSGTLFDWCNAGIMIVLMLATLYPLLYVIFASFSDPAALGNYNGFLLHPVKPTLVGYKLVLNNPSLWTGFRNTITYVALGTAISLTATSLGAYVLSRKGVLWNKALMLMVVFTMFFSGGLIPFFLLIKSLGMINTVWAIVLPSAISAWNLIVMRTFFQNIPDDLVESAKMDGANDLLIFFRIVLPLSLAIMAVMGLFYAVSEWNSWFQASIFLRERSRYPLQLLLREILIQDKIDASTITTSDIDSMMAKQIIKYAIIVVTTVPILFVYPFLQKYFVKGVLIGSLKG